jgi:MerR family transcriptional regulator, heat shock protein HspR
MRFEMQDHDKFEVKIPEDEPVYPLNIVCDLLHMHYWTLHQLMREGILKEKKCAKAKKKLFSRKDIRKLNYIKYLLEDKGVNIKGVKIILEMETISRDEI